MQEGPGSGLVAYYGARAVEYERVYEKQERQQDLRHLHQVIPALFAGRHVLEVACGTGYWTRLIASQAASVTAFDLSPEVLALARSRDTPGVVDFRVGDAFNPDTITGNVDAAFAGFWWSHVLRERVSDFLVGLHRRMSPGSPVTFLDNRYVEGSNWPITRTDANGNTYQRRRLDDGTEHEVLKNFPTPSELRAAIRAAGGSEPSIVELPHYWCATYNVGTVS
jgi:demethylmenaquinone methyltransferase/2-methoxy-6-polyprenyl-1,4-benzoquinol methylase